MAAIVHCWFEKKDTMLRLLVKSWAHRVRRDAVEQARGFLTKICVTVPEGLIDCQFIAG